MKAHQLNTQEAPNKWWAARDAQMRNLANKSHHSAKDQVRAERMKTVLEMCYRAKGFYIAYGKHGISIKIDKIVAIADRKNLRALEKEWTAQGVVKKESAQGIIYRF